MAMISLDIIAGKIGEIRSSNPEIYGVISVHPLVDQQRLV